MQSLLFFNMKKRKNEKKNFKIMKKHKKKKFLKRKKWKKKQKNIFTKLEKEFVFKKGRVMLYLL